MGWEHTQSLGIYIIRPDGTDFRLLVKQAGYSLGTPIWSPDGQRLIYNNLTTEDTYFAHGVSSQQAAASTQLYSIDVPTGGDVVAHTSGGSLKVSQHYIGNSSNVGYVLKGSPDEGINYTATDATHVPFSRANLRNPSWSPDGSKVVYEIPNWTQLPDETELFSYDPDWDYRYMDVFPQINRVTSRLATTQKVLGAANGSLVTSSPLYTDVFQALDSYDIYSVSNATEVLWLEEGQDFGWHFTENGPSEGWRLLYVMNASNDPKLM